jgi:hypothetical protein
MNVVQPDRIQHPAIARHPAAPVGGRGYPLRMRPQTLQERLMPRAQFEALERHQQAWRDRGIDSDKLTVQEEDKGDEDDP